jgi:hypothetical protein
VIRALKLISISFICLVASIIFFLTWIITANFRVESAQPNGLVQVLYPYSGISLLPALTTIGLLIFGATVGIVTTATKAPKQRGALNNKSRRQKILGSAVLSIGTLGVLFALYWTLANYLDEQPRCYDFGCPASTLLYYNEVYFASIILVILGIVAIIFGAKSISKKTTQPDHELTRAQPLT